MLRKLIMVFLLLGTSSGLQWSENLRPERGPVQVCSGENIQLLWNFTLDEGERLKGIVWECQPEGKEEGVLATFVDDHFVPMSSFSGRLAHLQAGIVELSCATILESGNYSISVSVEETPDSLTVHRNTALVQVMDMPKSPEDELRASVEPEAVRDIISGEWHVQLSCGNISDRGHPAVDAMWTTPTGERMNSSGYEDGFFHLLLPNPPVGGTYKCSIPSSSQPATRCLPADSPLLATTSVAVDETAARFSLLEARQQELSDLLKEQKDTWTDTVGDMANRTEALEQWRDGARLKIQAAPVSFHARLAENYEGDSRWPGNNRVLKLGAVTHNIGNGYNALTGKFTAPFDGDYFFIATVETLGSDHRGSLFILREGASMAQVTLEITSSRYLPSGSSRSVSCHVLLALKAGQRVWLEGQLGGTFRKTATSFSGFRL